MHSARITWRMYERGAKLCERRKTKQVGLKLREEKCEFKVQSVTYAGHEFTSDGVKPGTSKVAAILQMPIPTDKRRCGDLRDWYSILESLYQI